MCEDFKVIENWRYWDDDGTEHFSTEKICDFCGNPGIVYLELDLLLFYEPALVCKTCLMNGIKKLDEAIIENCKKAERK